MRYDAYLLLDAITGLDIGFGDFLLLYHRSTPMTFGDMVTKITTEIRAAVPTADIKYKIIEAIDAYKHHSFWFNQVAATMTLQSGKAEYLINGVPGEAPADILEIEDITILHGSRPLTLVRIDPMDILADTLITTTGIPSHWSIHHNSILFYPTPNSGYTVNLYYIQDFSELSTASLDAESDYWTDTAERLIRNFAKALIFGELLRNDTEQNRAVELASRAFLDLKSKSTKKTSGFQVEHWEM